MSKRLLMGNEAFAHAALEAGVGLFAGYPGTPSSELIETVAKQVAKGTAKGVHVEWSTNEKAALEVAAAASMSGIRALFTCKQVGLNVASDALMSLNYVGVRGGLVLFVTDDPGPISSQTEQDTRRFAKFAKVPVLDPATPEQGYQMMKAAFDLSERYGTPVIVRPTTRISHASTFFNVEDETQSRGPIKLGSDGLADTGAQGFVRDPDRWVIFPKRSYEAHGEIDERLGKIMHMFCYDEQFACFNPVYIDGKQVESIMEERAFDSSATLGIVASGISASYVREALRMLREETAHMGISVPDCKFMQVGTSFPAPRRIFTRFFKGLSDIIVFEELDSVIEEELLQIAGTSFLAPNIHGKLTGEAPTRGENSTEELVFRIAEFFDKFDKNANRGSVGHGDAVSTGELAIKEGGISARRSAMQKRKTLTEAAERLVGQSALYSYGKELPPRPPVLCAGCPHRGSFYAVKRALAMLRIPREDAVLCGDIGCYTLGNAEPLDAVDTCLCMGAGMTMAQGFAVTNPSKKCLAFIGDSTFFASGLTGVANAVYNDHDVTFFVLDNSTTAMTGMQPHPGGGATLMGTQSNPIEIARVLQALGVKSVDVANPLDRNAAEDICAKAIKAKGPSAVVFESPCIWLKRNDRVAKVNHNRCTGCKKCITEIGCPAISFNMNARGPKSGKRGQAVIDISQCNGCSLCAQICPFQAIRVFKREELGNDADAQAIKANNDSARIALGNVSEDGEVEYTPNAEAENSKIESGADGPSLKADTQEMPDVEGDGGHDETAGQSDELPEQSVAKTDLGLTAAFDGLFGNQLLIDLEEDGSDD